jgi:hypothetical protein
MREVSDSRSCHVVSLALGGSGLKPRGELTPQMRKFLPRPRSPRDETHRMTNLLLYVTTVLIWGTTWIALKLQLGVVAIAWSIAYRFWLAAAVLMLWLAWTAWRKQTAFRLPPRDIWSHLLA